MRDVYHFPKVSVQRIYSSVPELPMGQQAQVDFGQAIVKNKLGGNKPEKKNSERLMKWAEFPEKMTFESYDLKEQTAIGEESIDCVKTVELDRRMFHINYDGPTAGKTHLSSALGIHAVESGYQVYFVSMSQLIYILKTKEYTSKSRTRYKRIVDSDFIIIDDVIIGRMRHKKQIYSFNSFTTYTTQGCFHLNVKQTSEWGNFLGDPTLTTAILDRLLHRCEDEEAGSIRMKYRKALFNEEPVES